MTSPNVCLICKKVDAVYKPPGNETVVAFICSLCITKYSNMDEEDIRTLFPVTDLDTAMGFKLLRGVEIPVETTCPYCGNPFRENFTHSTCGLE